MLHDIFLYAELSYIELKNYLASTYYPKFNREGQDMNLLCMLKIPTIYDQFLEILQEIFISVIATSNKKTIW